MKRIKVILCLLSVILLCACSNDSKESVVDNFEKKINSVKSYTALGTMEIVSNEETYEYTVEVNYKYEDNYKVTLVNKTNEHEQVILKNEDGVYVVTPALNKSFKFQSEWPNNSSQSYLLASILDDIKNTEEPVIDENDDYFIVNADANYPNNSALTKQKIYFDKDSNLKEVQVLNENGNAVITMKFTSIEYSSKFSDDTFKLDSLVTEADCEEESCEDLETSILNDIVYPLYLPADTYLSTKDTLETDTGDRVIMTYAGAKPFMIIEEAISQSDEMEITSIYGDPLLLSMGVAALSTNSLEWQTDNVKYYITSSYLTSEELMTIAESLSTASVLEITNK